MPIRSGDAPKTKQMASGPPYLSNDVTSDEDEAAPAPKRAATGKPKAAAKPAPAPAPAPPPTRTLFDSFRSDAARKPAGGAESEDEAAPAPAPAPAPAEEPAEEPAEDALGDEEDLEADEHATLAAQAEAPLDPQAVASRYEGNLDVIVAEAEASRNAVAVEDASGGRPAQHGSAAPHVPAVVDPSFAQTKAIIKAVGPAWEWYQVDMSKVEHAAVHEGDFTVLLEMPWDLFTRKGKVRRDEQVTFYGIGHNADRMIAQAIIFDVNDPDADEEASTAANKGKPMKLFTVPVQLVKMPSAPKDKKLIERIPDLDGCTTLVAIEPEVVQKLYWKKDIGSKSLPTDLSPDRVKYVSFTDKDYWKTFTPHQSTWRMHSSTDRRGNPSGAKKNKEAPPDQDGADEEAQAEAGADDAPAPAPAPASAAGQKRPKPATASTLDSYVRAGAPAKRARAANGDAATRRTCPPAEADDDDDASVGDDWCDEVDAFLHDPVQRHAIYDDKFEPLPTKPNCGVHEIVYRADHCLVEAVAVVGNKVFITLKDPNSSN